MFIRLSEIPGELGSWTASDFHESLAPRPLFRLPTLPFVGEWLTRPNRKGTRRSLRECFYDPALVTDELIEVSYQRAAQPGAQQAFLSTVRTLGTVSGLRDGIRHSIVDNLDRLTMPVLVIWGQQDRLLSVDHAQVAANRIPNVRLHIFDQCGHCPAEEHPNAFNALVLEFLAG